MTKQEQLADAEARYHELITGQLARVVVDQAGDRIEYTAANAGRLAAYIERLKKEIAEATGGAGAAGKSGPMRVMM